MYIKIKKEKKKYFSFMFHNTYSLYEDLKQNVTTSNGNYFSNFYFK